MIGSDLVQLDFLTNEPVDGEILADKLSHGPVSPDEGLQYAIEIGGALSRIHARGLIHGNISPSSIILRRGGACLLKPPVLDFRSRAYRAPEQVLGSKPDWRSDIFSFGAVVYELATGRRAFPGEGQQLDRQILEDPPAAIRAKSPEGAAMEGVIAGCMARDPERRRQRIQNAVIELKLAGRSLPRIADQHRLRPASAPELPPPPDSERQAGSAATNEPALADEPGLAIGEPTLAGEELPPIPAPLPIPSIPLPAPSSGGFLRRYRMVGLLLLIVAAGCVAAAIFLHRPAAPVYRFNIALPEDAKFAGMPAISPDGRYLTFSAIGAEGKRMLWVRALDETHAKLIPGTEGALAPFWSPDSQRIGFFANRALKKVPLKDGSPAGQPVTVCDAEAMGGGGSWNSDGVILFAPGLSGPLYRVSAGGGKPQPVTKLDALNGEAAHLWPQFLPDGKRFIFFTLAAGVETTGVYSGSLGAPEHHRIFAAQTNAVFSAVPGGSATKGYLLYIRDRNLVGQAFDASTLQSGGDPSVLGNDVGPVESLSLAQVSVSNNGILIYQSAGKATRQLLWLDRNGNQGGSAGEAADWGPPRVSPDGTRVAAGRRADKGDYANLWIFGPDSAELQLTSSSSSSQVSPVWSPDGGRVAFAGSEDGGMDLYAKPASGDGKIELLHKTPHPKHPDDWTHDGRFILFTEANPGTRTGVWALSMADHRATAIVDTIHEEGYATVSPDGKWLAYQSDETGMTEVYVQPFDNGSPGTKRLTKVSSGGGGLVRWRKDGAELFYITPRGALMAASTHLENGEFAFDPPRMLFRTRPIPRTWNLYDAAPDGQRFVVNVPMEWPNSTVITVTTSWTQYCRPVI